MPAVDHVAEHLRCLDARWPAGDYRRSGSSNLIPLSELLVGHCITQWDPRLAQRAPNLLHLTHHTLDKMRLIQWAVRDGSRYPVSPAALRSCARIDTPRRKHQPLSSLPSTRSANTSPPTWPIVPLGHHPICPRILRQTITARLADVCQGGTRQRSWERTAARASSIVSNPYHPQNRQCPGYPVIPFP